VTATGIADNANTRGRLALPSSTTGFYTTNANLSHSDGTLTFAGDLEVNVNGLLVSSDRIVFAAGTQLTGSGTVQAANGIALNGQTLPGNSPGTLTFEGDVTFGATHNLVLEIGNATFASDRLFVNGALTVDGTLTLVFTDGFNPLPFTGFSGAFDPAFPRIGATSIVGTFTSLAIEGIDPALFNYADLAKIAPLALFAAIPEPSAYASAFGLAVLALAATRRRAVRQKLK
jgi:hypothetical protein